MRFRYLFPKRYQTIMWCHKVWLHSLPSQMQTFFTLRTVFTNIKQIFVEDSFAVFNVCKHLLTLNNHVTNVCILAECNRPLGRHSIACQLFGNGRQNFMRPRCTVVMKQLIKYFCKLPYNHCKNRPSCSYYLVMLRHEMYV